MKTLILSLFLISLFVSVFAQKESHWQLKVGLHHSNMIFHHLPFPDLGTLYDSTGQFVGFLTGYGGGHFQYRLAPNVMVYKEKQYKNWLHLLVGIGYRQRGYLASKFYGIAYGANYPQGIPIKEDIETRLHYLSSDWVLRFNITKGFYVMAAGRADLLLHKKTAAAHEYIANSLTSVEISPVLTIGKQINLCDYQLLIEFEVNRGLQNVSKIKSDFQSMPPTKVWNMSYGFNLGLRL
ncbi:hypothetical protein [Thermoflexibacter ruber]|uniref:Outer membrane protein beta-barrel domain-containing protein n=1 Tax=Thermoflexibacter ruber TaxID=1003 RepID=A0A1I2KAG2_9BACT|nr:hypothetical protein [Thermoflexibacter ruber]SFF63309.1 hypothetical protein SAMN04488541_10962 [Thermoflexibacter ruber]